MSQRHVRFGYGTFVVACAAAALSLSGIARAELINVPADYSTIQDAVNVAFDGDEIVVGPGIYTGTGNNVVDTLGKALTLRSSNGPEVTFIDGQDLRRGINCSGSSPTLVTVVGFTVRNGTAPGESSARDGGGLLAQCDLMMDDCIIEACLAGNQGGGVSFGGVPYPSGVSVNIENCTFRNNTAGYGGAVCSGNCYLTMSNCQLTSNYGTDSVGGILIYNDEIEEGFTYLENLVLTGNVAVGGFYGRAGGIQARGDVTLKHCDISDNLADSFGGGVVNSIESLTLRNGLSPDGNPGPSSTGNRNGSSSITIDNCIISNNVSGDVGGGLYCADKPNLMNTAVCDNVPNQIYGGWSDNGGNCVQESCDDCDLAECPADFNGDDQVNGQDLGVFLVEWGECAGCAADFNGDGFVDGIDLGLFLVAWGPCP